MDGLKDSAKRTVLVVDDEPLVRLTIADMLRLGGFDVLEAGSAVQALELLANGYCIAALITDIRMPGMDGVDLSNAVRSTHPQMPVVFLSGDKHVDGAQLPAGTHYLCKPPDLRQLVATVFQAIDASSGTF